MKRILLLSISILITSLCIAQGENNQWCFGNLAGLDFNSGSPVALFTAPNHICPGTCTSFNNASVNATSFLWSFPGANPSTSVDLNPINICYNSPGQYDVMLIASNASGIDTLFLPNFVTVYPYPAPQGITQSGDTLFSNAGAVSYQWYHDGILVPGATDYSYVASEGGNYNIVATDANGCEVEAVIFDVVAGLSQDYLNDQFIFIYPNPADDFFVIQNLDISAGKAIDISIFNVLGEPVYSCDYSGDARLNSSTGGLLTVDCRLISSGMYWLEIKSADKKSYLKFIKQ
ncbi:MAG: T9SS type A sorting domain-containing protein [Bacteroidetes bacterium]|nr:T9SS type A sorting domain-containing protein [Bacteroidota bacterium]